MILLPNDCKYSISVFPKDWQSKKADLSLSWYIDYRFVDPKYKTEFPKGYTKRIKNGFAECTTYAKRKYAMQFALESLTNRLEKERYNPITPLLTPVKAIEIVPVATGPLLKVLKTTPVIDALYFALSKSENVQGTRDDTKSALKYISQSIRHLKMEHLSIYDIRVEHMAQILDYCVKSDIGWTAKRHNKVKAYLSGLFRYLFENGAASGRIPRDVSDKAETKTIREIIRTDEIDIVRKHLWDYHRDFYNYMMMFSYSGGRLIELSKLKGKHVNLKEQYYRTEVEKGGKREVDRTIIKGVLPFWEAQMKDCGPNDYVFSNGMLPGPLFVSSRQVTIRWKKHVKKTLSITANLYSLKHANSGDIIKEMGEEVAAFQNGHTSTDMVRKIYAKEVIEKKLHKTLKERSIVI